MELTCTRCQRVYTYDRSKGHNKAHCNSCNANRKRMQVKAKAVEYKGGKCENCGYDKSLRALGFHHRNRSTKKFTIARAMSLAWKTIKAELDKCLLLCANCHMEEEDRLLQV